MIALGPHPALQKVDNGIALASQHRQQRLMGIDEEDRLSVIAFDDSNVAAFLDLEDANGHAINPQENPSGESA